MKRIIYVVFTLVVIVFSVHFSSCKGNNGNQSKNDETTAPLTLSNWEDTLAYALGVRYYQEKSTGYSRSLKEYLATEMLDIYGTDNYSEYFQSISQKGVTDAETGKTILPLSFVGNFLNLFNCENIILKYEKEIPIESDEVTVLRMRVLMNNTYKRIQFILHDLPSFPYSFRRIENYEKKRDSILALPPEMFVMPKTSNTSTVPQSETTQKTVGNWTLKENHYESPIIKDEYGDLCKIKFLLSKGKIEVVFSERIEAEYEMKLIVNNNEHTITGSRNGKTFTITSSNEISTILAVLDRGNFTFQYMFLDSGASHWGWSDYPITSQLKQASDAYSAISSK